MAGLREEFGATIPKLMVYFQISKDKGRKFVMVIKQISHHMLLEPLFFLHVFAIYHSFVYRFPFFSVAY